LLSVIQSRRAGELERARASNTCNDEWGLVEGTRSACAINFRIRLSSQNTLRQFEKFSQRIGAMHAISLRQFEMLAYEIAISRFHEILATKSRFREMLAYRISQCNLIHYFRSIHLFPDSPCAHRRPRRIGNPLEWDLPSWTCITVGRFFVNFIYSSVAGSALKSDSLRIRLMHSPLSCLDRA
jgi:hypothetical protein